MKVFHYKAKEGPQKIVEGTIEAPDQDHVTAFLTRKGLFPIEVIAVSGNAKESVLDTLFKPSGRPSNRQRIAFFEQLADLLTAGMPLLRALELLGKQASGEWQNVLLHLKESIRSGMGFSEALEKYPEIFSNFAISMVRAGEQSGAFETALREVADASNREEELKSRIKQSLIYPGVISCFGVLTILVLLIFVIPKLEELYRDFGGTLPLFTRVVLAVSRTFTGYWWAFALAFTALFVFLKRQGRANPGFLRQAIGRLPWFGRLLQLEDMVHFSRTLGLLLKNGVNIVEALSITAEIVQEPGFRAQVLEIQNGVSHGGQLARLMETYSSFTPLSISFVQTGEETGSLDTSLEKISRFYEKEIADKIKILTTLLEPLLILAIGSIVAVIVISMLLPIFEISLLVQ